MATPRGKTPSKKFVDDLKAARAKTGLSQSKFAEEYGLNVKTLQSWEIGRSIPRGLALTQMEKLIADILNE